MPKGLFIVIDGTDGAGKKTQTEMLYKRLKGKNHDVVRAELPQYGNKSAGPVEEYLNGKYGTADEVGPLKASIFYAVDRFDLGLKIKNWLLEGKIVICDRYTAANMAHQGGKISDPEKRRLFFKWLDQLEYQVFGIPRPDINIILHVEAEIAQKLVDDKGYRDYLGAAKRDIHENSLTHLKNAESIYLELAETFENFRLVSCTADRKILPKNRIAELVFAEVANALRHKSAADKPAVSPKLTLKVYKAHSDAANPGRPDGTQNELAIYSNSDMLIAGKSKAQAATGLRIEIPKTHVGRVHGMFNGVEAMPIILTSSFTNEIIIELLNNNPTAVFIQKGTKIARIKFVEN